jgi:hypothetical protein
MRFRTLTLTVVVVMLPFAPMARAQSVEGIFRGTFVCEKMPAAPDILRAPLDMSIRGSNVQFARPLFNWNGTLVVGSELGTGTVDPEGKLQLTSSWYNSGMTFESEYNGALTKTGGTFSGTQSWRDGRNNSGKRACTAALVFAPQVNQAGPQR